MLVCWFADSLESSLTSGDAGGLHLDPVSSLFLSLSAAWGFFLRRQEKAAPVAAEAVAAAMNIAAAADAAAITDAVADVLVAFAVVAVFAVASFAVVVVADVSPFLLQLQAREGNLLRMVN